MAFLNIGDAIITDKYGSIYSFRLIKSGIELILHEKFRDKAERSIIVNGEILEYDVSISEEDRIDLICKKKDKSLSIYSLNDGEWIESKIYEKASYDTCGLKIISIDKKIHIFYYRLSVEDNRKISIYHHYLEEGSWSTNIVRDIYKSEIIKPIELITEEDGILIGYYDLGHYSEDIFLSRFDTKTNEWRRPINITSDNKVKLYLDLLETDGFTHITYSEYEDENLIVKHKKIELKADEYIEISDNVLSNQVNCTYPTLIATGDVLWNVWTEYEHVVSAYSKDGGENWSNPYVWSESKKEDFARYKFSNNEDGIKENYKMNYSFSKTYPNLSLLGFGDLSGAVESVKKKEDFDEIIEEEEPQSYQAYYEYQQIDSVKEIDLSLAERADEIDRKLTLLEKEVSEMKKRLKIMVSLDKRISDIENHIYRRRNPFSSRI